MKGLLMLLTVKGASFSDGSPQEMLAKIQTTATVRQLCCAASQLSDYLQPHGL